MPQHNEHIRIRIETILRERGKTWPQVYKALGWHMSLACRVLNGVVIPSLSKRVALAQILNVDTSVIWTEADLISSYEQSKQSEVTI